MQADADIQVWLENNAQPQAAFIVPHVQSNAERQLHYKITTTQQSQGGYSSIVQSGDTFIPSNQATALSQLSINRQPNDSCYINIVLTLNAKDKRYYQFECPSD